MIAGAGAAALLVAGAGFWLLSRDGAVSAGPLGSTERSSVSASFVAGRPFAFGHAVAFNRGDRPAVLERIEPVNPTPGLEVIDSRVGGPRRGFTLAGAYRWPTDEFKDVHPVRGYRVAPAASPAGRKGAQLILALRAPRPGRYVFKAVAVEYTVDGERYRTVIRQGMGACVSARGEPRVRDCPPPTGL